MKKTFYLSGMAIMLAIQMNAQEHIEPHGGSHYRPTSVACIAPQDYERINALLDANIAKLKADGKLPANWGLASEPGTALKPTAGSFIWPLKQQPGFDYNSYYGISNYVDLNPLFPNQVLDYTCGARTYDQGSGYNHGGIDIFLWPFSQRMQNADQVAVIAAADGIVIGKDNGNSDQSCSLNGTQWNAVYIGNTDGTICWYGHLKNNSLLTKQVGESVIAGEYLGIVGSSGNSTGPHLHFETHNNIGDVIEPFEGACNPGQPSLWANQKPYIEPTINAVLTHNHAPIFPDCPQLETINDKTDFVTGDTLYTAAYFHDQNATNPASYKIYKPNNTLLDSWTSSANMHYTASYWYWFRLVTSAWDTGTYRFEVSYEGNTVSKNFTVNGTGTHTSSLKTGQAKHNIYPNPNRGSFVLDGFLGNGTSTLQIADISGKVWQEYTVAIGQKQQTIHHSLAPGMYLIKIKEHDGQATTQPFVVQ